ncbi:1-deoxy-D-xylulose-5-phosphate synthase [Rickettsiella grylli]|uniref:1-deoxy-D-xylulose-5-phosphate synthase n=1 Tax=Rickettsiella grylli TaxID=59196 RepID=UPI0008FD3C13|nr:1-deoxy-D-xylulose-5-phosphate synthase [Rickettsiella grylli]OIZ98557.1 1-deoxy-D-xylulose-5-phosphate synthase [Rickettsiella grylli]
MDLNNSRCSLLVRINSPQQLRELAPAQLPQLAVELRTFLIQTLNQCGGHFAANLGTIELTLALHYVFNTPHDAIIWDVGHQAYAHKILTGRRDQLDSIRKTHGLAPFPSRNESLFDSFGVGHSSTSISAALGFSIAAKKNNTKQKAIAVIGDGALTAGMAFEALNHAGDIHADLLVVLNDNDMSISNNVGALSNYFARILSSKLYSSVREGSKKILESIPRVRKLAKRTEEHVKGMLVPGTLFEELGFNYIGPLDGHDLPLLLNTFKNLRQLQGPQFVHVITTKGRGYKPAEENPIAYHAVNPHFLTCNSTKTNPIKPKTYANIFGRWICDMAAIDERLIAITPAMREGSDLVEFSERYPDRYFDVGIAEQHAVTLAAGLACAGLKPVVAIYSTFLQRAYDQLIHDVALQNLPVLFALDRAGIVGGDGATHQGCFDLSYLRCIPNMTLMTPSNENELRQMLYTGFHLSTPCAVRYPRGVGVGATIQQEMSLLPLGQAEICRKGQSIALLAFGPLLHPALHIGNQLDATVINMRFVKPLDEKMLSRLAKTHRLLVTLEENVKVGGAGSAVSEFLHQQGIFCDLLILGLPDEFIEHGDPSVLLAQAKLETTALMSLIKQRLALSLTF